MVRSIKMASAALSAVAVVALAAPVGATGMGQIEGGNIYRIKNITKNIDFTDPANADACDVLQYKVRIHNPGPSPLTNVNVKATLPGGAATTHTSTVTVLSASANPASTSDTAVLNLSSSQGLAYQSGSTELLDANGAFKSTLADGITSGTGVSIGNVGVSINEKRFVQFKVKVNCPEVPQSKFACEALSVTKVSRTQFSFTATASASNATVQSYTFTVKDANGNVVDTRTVTTSALSANYSFNRDTAGTYTVSVVVKTDKGEAPVGACTKQVTVEEAPTTPTPPVVSGKVTELPKTGVGTVAGLFAGVSALAGVGHYVVRRYIA